MTPKAVGTTVIKAESEENDNFKAGSASYTLTVEEVFVCKTYELVTNANVLKAGDNIIIVSPTNDYAISTNQQKNNRTGVAVTLNEDNTITSTADVAAIVLGGEKDAWTFETNGGYLYAPATGEVGACLLPDDCPDLRIMSRGDCHAVQDRIEILHGLTGVWMKTIIFSFYS